MDSNKPTTLFERMQAIYAPADSNKLADEMEAFFARIDERNAADDLIGWQAVAGDICQCFTDQANRQTILAALRQPTPEQPNPFAGTTFETRAERAEREAQSSPGEAMVERARQAILHEWEGDAAPKDDEAAAEILARAVLATVSPSPDVVGLRDAIVALRGFVVLFLAFEGRDRNTERMDATLDELRGLAAEADQTALEAIASIDATKGADHG